MQKILVGCFKYVLEKIDLHLCSTIFNEIVVPGIFLISVGLMYQFLGNEQWQRWVLEKRIPWDEVDDGGLFGQPSDELPVKRRLNFVRSKNRKMFAQLLTNTLKVRNMIRKGHNRTKDIKKHVRPMTKILIQKQYSQKTILKIISVLVYKEMPKKQLLKIIGYVVSSRGRSLASRIRRENTRCKEIFDKLFR
ncbi:uncharacterized protein LOC126264279 isoform X2 [Aethina tumida]|uniref:uncharacterized protein LOC126264279 isoform X2 n=1 Tax=Aethina tumida TaxID=116153 RepID=UPI0021475E7A|nr:uncharacterized protein LOC126264279 isoform X2 [Aethina tumida]